MPWSLIQHTKPCKHSLHYNIWSSRGRAILGLDHTTRDKNINWKVIIKLVTLYMIWSDHVPFLVMFGHAPTMHASINPYHILPVFIRSIHGSHPSSLPWNSHETTFYTASTFKVVHAIESGVRPSPFSPGYLRVFPGCRGSLGRDHPWLNNITGSFPTPMKQLSHTPLSLRLSWP